MAFTADTVWEVRQGGADDQGGGFDAVSGTPGTDRTLQDAVHATFTDLVIDGSDSTKCTSAATPFASDDVGNVINVTSGTNFTVQRVQIMSVAGVVATCDKSLGTTSATGGNGKLGGALGSPGKLTDVMDVAGQTAYIKYHATAYSMTTGTAGSEGPLNLSTNMASKQARIIGYDTTRAITNTDASKPTLDANAQTGINMVYVQGTYNEGEHIVRNVICDGQDNATVVGFYDNSGYSISRFEHCEAVDCAIGFSGGARGGCCWSCLATSCAVSGFKLANVYYCRADTCGIGFHSPSSKEIIHYRCIAHDCTGDGFQVHYEVYAVGCISVGNGGDGFFISQYEMDHFVDCISYLNTAYQLSIPANSQNVTLKNFAADASGSGMFDNTPDDTEGLITLVADPFVDRLNDDFNINDTVGGGALLRAATLVMP